MTKGEHWMRRDDGTMARFRATGTTTYGVRGVWLDGYPRGEALVCKEAAARMVEAAKRGRDATTEES